MKSEVHGFLVGNSTLKEDESDGAPDSGLLKFLVSLQFFRFKILGCDSRNKEKKQEFDQCDKK